MRMRSLAPTRLLLGGALAAADKPNVLVIQPDDQGWADTGHDNPIGLIP